MPLLARSTSDDDAPAGPKPAPAAQIYEWLRVLYEGQPGLVNLRAFRVGRHTGTTHNESEIYAADEKGLKALAKHAREITPRAPAVYATVNPVMSTVGMGSARAELIARRLKLFVDFDAAPTRGDRSSSDEEKQYARLVARNTLRWLAEEHGWPGPIFADSGNGYHALYRIDLPNDDASAELVRAVLRALNHKFGDEDCKIDPVMFNADRLTKVYGTLARTGEHSELYPHRASAILHVPDDLVVVTREQLEAVAALAPEEPKPSTNGHVRKKGLIARAADSVEDAYCHEGLDRELGTLARAMKGDRNNQLFRSAAAICELVNTGRVDEGTAFARLRETALAIGLTPDEVDASIASARKKTAGKARDLTRVGQSRRAAVPTVPDPETGVREKLDDPHRLARAFLRGRYHHADGPTLRFWQDELHAWRDGAWRAVADRELNAEITAFLKGEFDRSANEMGGDAKKVSPPLISATANAIRGYTLVPQHQVPEQPAWLSDDAGLPDPLLCLTTRNGIVDLPRLIDHGPDADGSIRPPTPLYFSSTSLSYPFDPSTPPPARWLRFLSEVWPDDPESIRSLQQWFGYLVTPDTSQQKILMLIGPKRSGKGTIARVLKQLVGEANYAAPTLSALGTQFGLQPLLGKTLAVVPESRLTGRSDSQQIVERLLSISGEDSQSFDRKGIAYWHGRLRVRFVLSGNELPRLSDYSGAMASRLIVLKMTESFLGREDHELEHDLAGEMAGILLWAIGGWQDLREAGRFTQPASGLALLNEFEVLTNPIGAFLHERCDLGPDKKIPVKDLYKAWKSWCEENGREHPGDIQGFGTKLAAACSTIVQKQTRMDGVPIRRYHGVDLKGEAF